MSPRMSAGSFAENLIEVAHSIASCNTGEPAAGRRSTSITAAFCSRSSTSSASVSASGGAS